MAFQIDNMVRSAFSQALLATDYDKLFALQKLPRHATFLELVEVEEKCKAIPVTTHGGP
jgi:hypothetical protein